ncbi:MAG: sulfotransferase [Cephaloticoccus sp.]|nr:sulfotransferase [Cephaloticoccus sp.]
MISAKVIFIVGPYRSGTSITSRVVAALGVNFGGASDLIPADTRNPSGYFERDDLNKANQHYIESAGGSLESPGHPEHILDRGDVSILQNCDLNWMQHISVVGIKDPRMCATLSAWFSAGIFNPQKSRIIHIRRDLEATVRSAKSHDHVAQYCAHDPRRIRKMITEYTRLATFQAQSGICPVLTIDYEELVKNPAGMTKLIADFLDVSDPVLIQCAASNIGKHRAQFRFQLLRQWRVLRFRVGFIKNAILGRIFHK